MMNKTFRTGEERFDQYEVLREAGTMIDNLPSDSERRQVMVSLAERYGLRVSDKRTTAPRGFAPGFRRKRAHG